MYTQSVPSDRRRAVRSRIHQAALRLFAETGGAQLTVRDLAEAAGIARGTIYNNIQDPERLFSDVALDLSREMIACVERTMRELDDPVVRLATGLRLFVRRAHEDHDWGRFIVRFALSSGVLRSLMLEPPARDVAKAIAQGRFKADPSQAQALVHMLAGSTLAAMNAVIHGDQGWREAASATSELFLRAAGLSAHDARRIAHGALPDLAPGPGERSERRRRS
jgi:AcrR family transcriptional regulator